jgi:MFS family permease
VSAFVQGGLIRRLVPRFGEPTLIVSGLALLAAGLAGVSLAWNGPALLVMAVIVGVGQGTASPSIQGLLSRLTPPSEQGAVFGTLSSAQTLARFINYLAANVLLGRYGPSAPYLEASAVAAVGLALALGVPRRAVGATMNEGETTSAEIGASGT